jgi:monoamine oxidase
VENWLNTNTVDTLQIQKEDRAENGLEIMQKQPAFMDIFVDKMGELHKEIHMLNQNNKTLHEMFMNSMKYIENIQNRQQQSMHSMAEVMQTLYRQSENSAQSTNQLAQIVQQSQLKQQKLLSELVDLQKREIYQMTDLNTQMEDLAHISIKSQQQSNFNEEKIANLLENSKNDDQRMLLFQMADTIDSMHRDILKQMQNIKPDTLQIHPAQKSEQPEESSFLEKHFGFKKHNSKVES